MKPIYSKFTVLLLSLFFFSMYSNELKAFTIGDGDITHKSGKSDELVVLWTSGDPEVAKKMVFMYVYNAKKQGWWKELTFIIWGPSSRLLAEDKELQNQLKKMKEIGIKLKACKACADQYSVSEKLEKLGVEVKYMGKPLTDYIKGDSHVLTF
jgi:hypothetical protein